MAYDPRDRYLVDLDVPLDDELPITPSGDLALASGPTNLRRAVQRRALVLPGTLVHRPEYGGGLVGLSGQPASLSRRAQAATAIRRSLLRDDRVQDASVAISVEGRDGAPYVLAEVTVRPRGDDTTVAVAVET